MFWIWAAALANLWRDTWSKSAPALQMLILCSAQFPEQQWIHADMRTLTLGCQFDAIIAWNSFFHLKPTDQRLMFPIFRRHAAPGA